jgi:hypothetical protein
MTKRATATQAQVSRMIKAALESGLQITGIVTKPDGSVLVATGPLGPEQRAELGQESDVVLWLVERYRETSAWTNLSLATRRQRENIFRHVLETAGKQPLSKITTPSIITGRDRRAATPSQARHFLDAMRGLFRWAAKAKNCQSRSNSGSR